MIKIVINKRFFVTCIMAITMSVFSYGQNLKLSIDFENVAIEKVLDYIEKNSNYKFSYNSDKIDVKKKISINVKETTVINILDEVFKETNISYTIINNQIVLKLLDKSNLKKVKVKGVILDESGTGLPGVTVLIENSSEGTVSNIDGEFDLMVTEGATLKISSIGFKTKYYRITRAKDLRIILSEDRQILDEVVVVGYGAVSRKNLTTSISTVKPENISKSATSNISQMLMGRASGLKANLTSPQPDGKIDLSIRGAGTPLFIVDGIMMPSDALEVGSGNTSLPNSINRSGLAGLNPNDIESIEVLKDASASIYGIGAANGVILVTTKKGKAGRTSVSYEGNYSWVNNKNYIEALDANQYMNVNNVFSKELYLLNNNMKPYGEKEFDGGWLPYYSAKDIAENKYDTDWVDLVLKSGFITNHNVTINGGSEKFQYYLGLNYFDQGGTVVNSGMKKYAIHTNISAQLFTFMKLTTNLNYNQNTYTNSTVGADNAGVHTYGAMQSALTFSPLMPIKDNGVYSTFLNVPNPVGLSNIDDKTNVGTFYANFNVDFNIIKNILTARLVYGMNKDNTQRSLYIPSDVYFNQMLRSRGNLGNSQRLYQTMEGTVNFNYNFFDLVNLNLMAGMGLYKTSHEGTNIYYENTNDQIENDNIAIANGPFYPSSFRSGSERRSQFMRADFDICDRYVINFTLRRDGTDKFFPGSKYALFPSVSMAWKVSNEAFLKDLSWLNLLKMRFSYGLTGRDNLGSSLYGLYSPSEYYVLFNEGKSQYVPFILIGMDYPDVSWEKTQMINAGIDFSLLKDRIWGSFDWFYYRESNMLSYDPESWKGMFTTRPVNDGSYKRVGFDFNLNTRNIKTVDFEWNSLFNISRYQSLWLERVANYDYKMWQRRKNEPLNAWYFYKSNGIINSEMSNMPNSQRSLDDSWQLPGMPIIVDKDGNGVINEDDIYMRDNTPKVYVGFGNTFKFKGFDLDIFMYGNLGLYKYNPALGFGTPLSGTTPRNTGTSVYEAYNSISNPNGTRPGVAYYRASGLPGGLASDVDYENASFIRVRNITLGYNFNNSDLGRLGRFINSIRIYADLQNPFCFTNFHIIDPETKNSGGQNTMSDYPQNLTFSLGTKWVF